LGDSPIGCRIQDVNASSILTSTTFAASAESKGIALLRWRLISAAVILTILLTLVWLDYQGNVAGAWLLPVLLAVSLLATEEVLSLLRAKGHRPIGWLVYAGNVLMPLAAALPIILEIAGQPFPADSPLGPFGWPLVVLALAAGAVFIGEMARFHRPGTAIVDAALAIFSLVYIGLLTSFWALLRLFHSNEAGLTALLSMLVIVKMADVGAYAFGKNFGRTKMMPILSPRKTWEGAIGGIATACLTSWAFFAYLAPALGGSPYPPPGILPTLIYGLLLALAGTVGDLAESLLKRDMERKDSSSWLPGLGGVLDIIDAVLIAAPVAWLCWVFGLVGPG
jgi:phosphatidate cytidylyltransferase